MKMVPKEWGSELWIANNDYCGKILNLKKGYRSSIHKHKIKHETFFVIDGKVFMELGRKKWIMMPGSSVHIPRNRYHRFSGLEESKMIEFSSRHFESDSYRKTKSGRFDLQEVDNLIKNTDEPL